MIADCGVEQRAAAASLSDGSRLSSEDHRSSDHDSAPDVFDEDAY